MGQKKAANNFFDADHHLEPHKIEFKSFDKQSDVQKRGLQPVNNENSMLTILPKPVRNFTKTDSQCTLSRVHISSDEVFSHILKKPTIVQKKMIPHMNGLLVFIEMKQRTFFL